jgi:succinate dehydrogenase/fumarate reductase-like Fe-S protein
MSRENKGKSAKRETPMAELHVRRGGPEDSPHFDVFQVPRKDTMSVLDALIWIRQHLDSSLAIRYSCINANACKECGALVNGSVTYLCTARVGDDPIKLEPLPKRPLIRDLVTDILPGNEHLPADGDPS